MLSTQPRPGMGQVYRQASAEAKRRGDRRVSTEHIALAMLVDPDSETARALGVSLESARAALDTLDREALTSVGIEVINNPPSISGRKAERFRLTPAGRGVFTGLRREAGGERIGVKHSFSRCFRMSGQTRQPSCSTPSEWIALRSAIASEQRDGASGGDPP